MLLVLLVLLLLKLSSELLLLHLMQNPKKVHCRVRGRGGSGELCVAAARWPW